MKKAMAFKRALLSLLLPRLHTPLGVSFFLMLLCLVLLLLLLPRNLLLLLLSLLLLPPQRLLLSLLLLLPLLDPGEQSQLLHSAVQLLQMLQKETAAEVRETDRPIGDKRGASSYSSSSSSFFSSTGGMALDASSAVIPLVLLRR